MRHYEGLFILDTAGAAEDPQTLVDSVKKMITQAGGTVEAEEKLDKRPFARVANKKHSAGFYVNLKFHCEPTALPALEEVFAESEMVFRVQLTLAAPAEAPAA